MRILLVEDEKGVANFIIKGLQEEYYSVDYSTDAEGGMLFLDVNSYDLIILDVIMPGKGGFNAAEEFKKDPELQKVPVIMLTSFADRRGETNLSVSQGLTLDTEDYIDKPVAPEELLKRVEKLLK